MTPAQRPSRAAVESARRDFRFIAATDTHGDDTEWRKRARCRTRPVDPEIFFPVSTGANSPVFRPAVDFCVQCPVTAPCLAFALNIGECEGVWGETEPAERRAMVVAWREFRQEKARESDGEVA